MKGLIFSLTIITFTAVVLFFYLSYGSALSQYSNQMADRSISDKVYYRYASIESNLRDILEEELGIDNINFTLEEDTFNIVNITELLPADPSAYRTDMDRYKAFEETKANQSNVFVSLNISEIKDKFPITILPYGIDYLHVNEFGQREVEVDPKENWAYIEEYNILINVIQGNITSVEGWSGPGCNGADFNLDIIIVGDSYSYTDSRNIDAGRMCKFTVDLDCPTGGGFVKVTHNSMSRDEDRGLLRIDVQQNCNVTSQISLNLTDMPGKLGIGLPPQAIKVKEVLYQTEKNDTVYIY